jgi:hypothetical protein
MRWIEMGIAETKRFMMPYGNKHGKDKSVISRVITLRGESLPDFSKEEKDEMRQERLRARIRSCREIIAGAVKVMSNFCQEANAISCKIGENRAKAIVGKIRANAESVALAADGLQSIIGEMGAGTKSVEDAYDASIAAQDSATAHRDAAHETLEELKKLQKRLLAESRAQGVIEELITLGVNRNVANELSRIDWNIAEYAVKATRAIAAEKDSKNLSYDSIVDAIEAVFRNKKYELQKILSERKYYYEGGLPDTDRIIAEIEKRSGVSFAAINDVPGVGLTHSLRRIKMLAIVNWLFYQPEYLWRFENLAKVSCCAEVKAEA